MVDIKIPPMPIVSEKQSKLEDPHLVLRKERRGAGAAHTVGVQTAHHCGAPPAFISDTEVAHFLPQGRALEKLLPLVEGDGGRNAHHSDTGIADGGSEGLRNVLKITQLVNQKTKSDPRA